MPKKNMRIAICPNDIHFLFFMNNNEAMRIILLFFPVFLLFSCSGVDSEGEKLFDGERAYSHVLRQLDFGERIPGTESHRAAGDWIIEELASNGWLVEEQTFTYRGVIIRNIVAGASNASNSSGNYILLGAHYDTRAFADLDPENPLAGMPGANDGASGVAVLLELSRVLKEDFRERVILVFFDAEDQFGINGWDGLVGSEYYADTLTQTPQAMILLDMIGDRDLQLYYERTSTEEIRVEIWAVAAELGYAEFIPEEKYAILDDHTPFLRRGIPAVDIIDFDYPYWHTSQDTSDKVSASSLQIVGEVIQVWLASRFDPAGP